MKAKRRPKSCQFAPIPAGPLVLVVDTSQSVPGMVHYLGLNLTETFGAAVTVKFRAENGLGSIFEEIKLAAGQSVFFMYEEPIILNGDVWAELTGAGTIEGSVRYY